MNAVTRVVMSITAASDITDLELCGKYSTTDPQHGDLQYLA